MRAGELSNWSDQLQALATASLPDAPVGSGCSIQQRQAFVADFRDEAGIRRSTDGHLISHLLGLFAGTYADSSGGGPEEQLWRAVLEPGLSLDCIDIHGSSELIPSARSLGLEAWTEMELSCLHALSTIAAIRRDEAVWARCRRAAEWHLAELQPDNATNRPWAVHAFVAISETHPHALMHAGTLVHNACVERGRPERRSALIMLHSAMVLRMLAQGASNPELQSDRP